jgi:hypothetical protein
MIEEIEDRLGYELSHSGTLEALSDSDVKEHTPKVAGWDDDDSFVAK